MISEAEALRLVRERVVAEVLAHVQVSPISYDDVRRAGGLYLADDPSELFFFTIQRREPGWQTGGGEMIAIRKRDGTVAAHETVGE